ncbi:methyltransferase domain-containing protein [Lysobacter sp. P5_B9]
MKANYEQLNIGQPESETDPFTEDRYRQFEQFIPSVAKSILDVGCNTGRGGRILKERRPHLRIAGMDAVQSRVQSLSSEVYSDRLHGLSTQIPSVDDSFDAVLAGEFIEHLYFSDVLSTLGEMFRVLRVGGRLLLTTPNPGDIKRRLRGRSILGGAHVSQHHPDSLKSLLRMSGFSNVRVHGSGKVTRYLGSRAPLVLYGSYLIRGDKI